VFVDQVDFTMACVGIIGSVVGISLKFTEDAIFTILRVLGVVQVIEAAVQALGLEVFSILFADSVVFLDSVFSKTFIKDEKLLGNER